MTKHILTIVLFLISVHCWSKPFDSLRIETIKGQQYILHLVEKGETLEAILKRYNGNLELTLKANELKNRKVTIKQVIKVPIVVDSSNKSQSLDKADTTRLINEAHANAQAKEETKTMLHQVVSGETIASIAKKYKITNAQIAKWNNIKNNKVAIGQVLIVDENAAIKPYLRLNRAESQLPATPTIKKLDIERLIQDTGMAIFDETGQIAHTTLPIGTIVKIVNLENNISCLVRITGNINQEKYKNFKMILGADIQNKLQANSPMIKIQLQFVQSR